MSTCVPFSTRRLNEACILVFVMQSLGMSDALQHGECMA